MSSQPPRRHSPLPPRLSPSPSIPLPPPPTLTSSPASLKELLHERALSSNLSSASPSPAWSSSSRFDTPETLHSSTFLLPNQYYPPSPDPIPTSENYGNSYSPRSDLSYSPSPSPSIASVKTAKVARVQMGLATTVAQFQGVTVKSGAEHQVTYSEEGPGQRHSEEGTTVFDLRVISSDGATTGVRRDDEIKGIVKHVSHQTRLRSRSVSADSTTSWKEAVSRGSSSSIELEGDEEVDPRMRPELESMTRMKSILGPKMKMISPAPWDLDGVGTNSVSSAGGSLMGAKRSSESSRRPGGSTGPSNASTASIASGTTNASSISNGGKENSSSSSSSSTIKPKAAKSRMRSYSAAQPSSSSRFRPNTPDAHASEEALRGLGLGLGLSGVLSSGSDTAASARKLFDRLPGKKSAPAALPLKAIPRSESFLDMDDDVSVSRPSTASSVSPITPGGSDLRRAGASAPPDIGARGSSTLEFPFPSPPYNSSSTSTPARKRYASNASKPRPQPPIVVDLIQPSSSLPLSLPPSPHSAPPTTVSFHEKQKSPRASTNLIVRIPPPPLPSSMSIQSFTSTTTFPPPTSSPLHVPRSPSSPLVGSPSMALSDDSADTSTPFGGPLPGTGGAGYKLISLEAARAREVDRIIKSDAMRKAMLPVEHLAGRDDVVYGGTFSTPMAVPNLASPSSTSGTGARNHARETSANSQSSGLVRGETSGSLSTLASATTEAVVTTSGTAKTLKNKKSGFLKRMILGGDKTPSPSTSPMPPLSPGFSSSSPNHKDPYADASVETLQSINVHHKSLALPSELNTPSATSATLALGQTPPLSGQSNFLTPRGSDPEQASRKSSLGGANATAPSLSLRPMSMAFSAGLPTDFLADATPGPRAGAGRAEGSASPFSTSFSSSTYTTRSSLFENNDDYSSLNSSTTTPLTPAFSPNLPFTPFDKSSRPIDRSPLLSNSTSSSTSTSEVGVSTVTGAVTLGGGENFLVLQEQFLKARRAWKNKQWELETQLRLLKAEIDEKKGRTGSEVGSDVSDERELQCEKCGHRTPYKSSVLSRPRPVQGPAVGSAGSLFGSGVAGPKLSPTTSSAGLPS